MRIHAQEVEWDEHNRKHLARHADVSEGEVEEALSSDCLIVAAGVAGGERRYEIVGTSASGRILVVIATTRGGKIRPITAYPAEGRRLRLYMERDKEWR